MSERIAPFSSADAHELRETAPEFQADSKAAIKAAPAAIKRYIYHYGFDTLIDGRCSFSYRLEFRDWAGYRIAVHSWRQPSVRGTVILAHGLFDHSGLYLKLVRRLLQEGYSVVSADLPGHGLSSGSPVAIDSFSRYRDLLAECLRHCTQSFPSPCYAVGQSTGCAAILSLLMDQPLAAPVHKVVLLAPLVRIYSWYRVALLHGLLKRFIKRVPRRFARNSHDSHFLHFLAHKDPLQATFIDVPWVQAMREWAALFYKFPPLVHKESPLDSTTADALLHPPLLIIQGTADTTVDWHWNVPLIQKKFPDAQARYIEGGLHHLVNEGEPWRREIFDALCDFLKA